jgi:hypothetical protein
MAKHMAANRSVLIVRGTIFKYARKLHWVSASANGISNSNNIMLNKLSANDEFWKIIKTTLIHQSFEIKSKKGSCNEDKFKEIHEIIEGHPEIHEVYK